MTKNRYETWLIMLFCCLLTQQNFAESNPTKAIKKTQDLSLGIEYKFTSDDFGIQAKYHRGYEIPMLRRHHVLHSNNGLQLDINGKISPVSLNGQFMASLTPIAFFKLVSSCSFGSGWSIGDIHGLGYNAASGRTGDSFAGLVFQGEIAAALQMKTEPLTRNPWINFLFLVQPQFVYKQFFAASWNETWIYQNDRGENFNGWMFSPLYFFGYRLPFSDKIAGTTGCLIQSFQLLSHRLDSPMNESNSWGSDFVTLWLSPLMSLDLGEKWTFTLVFQWERERVYTDESKDEEYFKNRIYKDKQFTFYRIQFETKFKF